MKQQTSVGVTHPELPEIEEPLPRWWWDEAGQQVYLLVTSRIKHQQYEQVFNAVSVEHGHSWAGSKYVAKEAIKGLRPLYEGHEVTILFTPTEDL